MACGSKGVLSLSRVLGGSLKHQQTAHVIADAELDRLVRELLSTVPHSSSTTSRVSPSFSTLAPSRHHARSTGTPQAMEDSQAYGEFHHSEVNFEPAIHVIAERANPSTGATGSALALRAGTKLSAGLAPGELLPTSGYGCRRIRAFLRNVFVPAKSSFATMRSENPRVDLASCHRWVCARFSRRPLRHFRRTLGVFEVLSAAPYAFDSRDVATMQLLSSVMVAAISRIASQRSVVPGHTA